MSQSFIPVFFCTDNNFTVPTYIALYSLLYNYRGNLKIYAYFLTPRDLEEDNIRLLESLSVRYDCLRLKFINMADNYNSVKINSRHISTTTLYRLMIPRIVKQLDEDNIEKCIYLDSDLIVEGNITELYNIDIDDYYIGGVKDSVLSCDRLIDLREMLGVPSLQNYINAGVLLMNLKEINKDGISSKLEKAGYRNDFPYNDQDVINSVCYEGIKTIPLKYNAMSTCLYHSGKDFYEKYGISNIMEARKNPVVIHYILRRKPWACRSMIMADKWWKYVRMQDGDIQRDFIQPFLDSHKAPLFDRLRETIKTAAIYLGIYNLARNGYYWYKNMR